MISVSVSPDWWTYSTPIKGTIYSTSLSDTSLTILSTKGSSSTVSFNNFSNSRVCYEIRFNRRCHKVALNRSETEMITTVVDKSAVLYEIWNVSTAQILDTISHDIDTSSSSSSPVELSRHYRPLFSPDNKKVALPITSKGNTEIKVYDLHSKKTCFISRTNKNLLLHSYSPDGTKILATPEEGGLAIIDAAKGNAHYVSTDFEFQPSSIAFTPSSKYVLAASRTSLGMYHVSTEEKVVNTWKRDNKSFPTAVSCFRDGIQIASLSDPEQVQGDLSLTRFTLDPDKPCFKPKAITIFQVPDRRDYFWDTSFSPDGSKIAARLSNYGECRVWTNRS